MFATDRCHMIEDPWQDGAIPIRFNDEDHSVTAIFDAARFRPIDGILAVGDRPTISRRVLRSGSACPATQRRPQKWLGTKNVCVRVCGTRGCQCHGFTLCRYTPMPALLRRRSTFRV
jgi:hypothetical protein